MKSESTRISSRKNSIAYARHLFLLLIGGILLFAVSPASAQICATLGKDGSPAAPITGVVNTYYPGTASVAATATSITLGVATGSSTAITSGDLLIVIQMQDASIDRSNNSQYGDGVNGSGYTAANGVGRYEFVKATNGVLVSGGTLNLQGANSGGLINAYTNANATATQGARRFQVVRVPQYLNVTLSSGLTATGWNGSTGGILALDVAGNVSLNSSTVSVVGLGFRGGAGLQLEGAGGKNTDYRNTAPASAVTLTGFHGSKGEGIAGTPHYVWNAAGTAVVDTGVEGYPSGSMARGAPGNAGGGGTDGDPQTANPGGNDQNSGGGGGGNGGAGGIGGNTWNSNLAVGGFGGVSFAERAPGRVVMGGAGGAGSRNNDPGVAAASSGAAGGGIVIIRAGAVIGTGTIDASGAAAYNSTLNDGGGGGGAGGSVILLTMTGNLSNLTVIAAGGRGGDAWRTQAPGGTPGNRHGPGGGGGGGVIFLSKAALSANVTGGLNGLTTSANDPYGATGGAAGPTPITNMNYGQIPGVQAGALCPGSPTDVTMVSLKATRYGDRVLLEWQTGYEISNIGFNIYREKNGNLEQVTPEPIAGSALFAGPKIALSAGFSYSWWDNQADGEDTSRYWIEDLDLTGRTTIHGPFGVDRAAGDQEPPAGEPKVSLLSALGRDASADGSTVVVEPLAKVAKVTQARVVMQSGIASQQAVKLSVQREGWYRVEQSELVAAGFSASGDPRKLQLIVDGAQVPIIVTSGKSQPGSMDGIEFYGIGIDSPFTANHVYWLVAGSEDGLRIAKAPAPPRDGALAPPAFSYTVERRDKVVYFPALKNGGGEKFFGPLIFNAQPVSQSLVLQHVAASSANATLELSLQGFTDVPHSVRVVFNTTDLGPIQFSGLGKGVAKYSVPQNALKEGSNQLQLIGPPGFSDISMVEYARLTYLHTNTADSNALRFPATGTMQSTIGGFTGPAIRVVDVTVTTRPQELEAIVKKDSGGLYTATVTPFQKGARTLLAFASDQQKKPAAIVPNQPSNWRDPSNAADYVVITRKDFISSLEPLKVQRKSQGLFPAVVDIEDVYDEFSFGNKTPQALKDFLSYARSSWKKAPRFVVLAGDATYDPKNYLGVGDFDIVPTKLVETAFNETATDDWFADSNGDGVPVVAIGRLPVRTAQETAAVVTKIVGYDKSAGTGRVLLLADRNEGSDFEGANDQLKALIPAGFTVADIRRGQVGDATARSQLLNGINQGQSIVNYYGHGSTRVWASAPLLTADDAASLVNQNGLSLFSAMTCLGGFFQDPTIESLGESLLKARGGAIAVWASSGMTDPGAQVVMSQEAMRQLFGVPGITIGEATARAKAATGNADVRRTWILFGDPATKLK
jgi:Peptidase family C25